MYDLNNNILIFFREEITDSSFYRPIEIVTEFVFAKQSNQMHNVKGNTGNELLKSFYLSAHL